MGDDERIGNKQEHCKLPSRLFKCSSENELNIDDAVEENLLIHIKLHSSTWDFSISEKDFSLPLKLMVDREKQYSIMNGKSSDPSFILRTVMEHCQGDNVPREFLNQTLLEDWYSFHCELTVLIDLDEVISSWDIVDWRRYLAHDIRKYYVTGKISVFEQGLKDGYDVLYAFECLDIPFDNRAVSYDSFATVIRSENRLTYYYHREDIALWIAKRFRRGAGSKQNKVMAFVTSPNAMTSDCRIYIDDGDINCEVLSMRVDRSFSRIRARKAVVHNILNEEHIDIDPNYMFILRTKFASFLENYLPNTKVSFQARKVIFVRDDPAKSFSSILPVLIVEKVGLDFKDSQDSSSEGSAYPAPWLSMFNLHNILSVDGFPCACSDDYDYHAEEDTATTTSSESSSDESLESRMQYIEQVTKEMAIKRKRPSSKAKVGRRASSSTPVDSMTAKWLVEVCLG